MNTNNNGIRTYKGFRIIKTSEKSFYRIETKEGKFVSSLWSLQNCKDCINNKLLAAKIGDFIKGIRQYRNYSLAWLIVEKTFNHGNGSLALFRFIPKRKVIQVNSCLATKRDMNYLSELQKALSLENYEITYKAYSYPEYYYKSF